MEYVDPAVPGCALGECVLFSPRICCTCGQVMCGACIARLPRRRCPFCRGEQFVRAEALNALVAAVMVRAPCGRTLRVDEAELHLKQCVDGCHSGDAEMACERVSAWLLALVAESNTDMSTMALWSKLVLKSSALQDLFGTGARLGDYLVAIELSSTYTLRRLRLSVRHMDDPAKFAVLELTARSPIGWDVKVLQRGALDDEAILTALGEPQSALLGLV